MDQIALGVGQDMALAAFDLLACIITAGPAALGGLDALAVDDSRAFSISWRMAACRSQSNRAGWSGGGASSPLPLSVLPRPRSVGEFVLGLQVALSENSNSELFESRSNAEFRLR
jgi:hypothetical protein